MIVILVLDTTGRTTQNVITGLIVVLVATVIAFDVSTMLRSRSR